MKYSQLFYMIFCFGLPLWLSGQNRNDYNWILGYPPNRPTQYFGGTRIDFNSNSIVPQYFETYCGAYQTAVLSSNSGRLLLYSDGCRLFNDAHQVIGAGDSLSYGQVFESYCEYGYPGNQNHLLLDWPGDSLKAVLFHTKTLDDYSSHAVLYSIVDFSNDYDSSWVSEKNTFLVDPGLSGLMTACRHANGRDWWVIIPEAETNRYFIFLVDPDGVRGDTIQNIGSAWGKRAWGSQIVFSPDGEKFGRFNPWKGLDIFDFDRCTGLLSNTIETGTFSTPVIEGGGLAFSYDSRYLFVSNLSHLYQFDMHSSDIPASKVVAGVYDGFQDPFATNFYQMMLAPDGRIYMSSTNGVKSMHVIKKPDQYGDQIEFIQHGVQLPAYVLDGSVNLPFFRLGPIDGSGCDTLGINNKPIADFRYEIDMVAPYQVNFRNLSYFMPTTHNWTFGNGGISSEKDPVPVTYSGPGVYTICLTVSNINGEHTFCQNVDLTDTISAISPVYTQHEIQFIPNPFMEDVTIVGLESGQSYTVQFLSSLGIEVLEIHLPSYSRSVDTKHLMPGVYYCVITGDNGNSFTGRVCKME